MCASALATPRFETLERGGLRLVVDPAFRGTALELALLDPVALARHLGARSGARGRAETARVALPGGEHLHLRPVRHGGRLAPLWGDRLLGLARPLRELEVCARLRARGAPVPRALCVIGTRRGLCWSAVLGTLDERDTQDGAALLASEPRPAARGAAIAAAARAVRRFHDAGGRHADLHLGNLLVRERAGGWEAIVIDLDGARAGAPPDASRRMRELMRLYRSAHKRGHAEALGVRGCARFLGAYCAGDRELRRALLARLPRERRRLARHALGWRILGRAPR